jgi:hypothetical protein
MFYIAPLAFSKVKGIGWFRCLFLFGRTSCDGLLSLFEFLIRVELIISIIEECSFLLPDCCKAQPNSQLMLLLALFPELSFSVELAVPVKEGNSVLMSAFLQVHL